LGADNLQEKSGTYRKVGEVWDMGCNQWMVVSEDPGTVNYFVSKVRK
jgi:hypothetical protein